MNKLSERHAGKIVEAVYFRMPNRRVKVALCRDGGFLLRFVRLVDGMPDVQRLRLSYAATRAVCEGVCVLLERKQARIKAQQEQAKEKAQ